MGPTNGVVLRSTWIVAMGNGCLIQFKPCTRFMNIKMILLYHCFDIFYFCFLF